MNHDIIPATMEHAEHIAAHVRQEDADEIWASVLQKPIDAMRLGIRFSDIVMTGTIKNKPVCMWGVVSESLIGSVGTPWMVASKDIERHSRTFLRHCKPHLMEMFSGYDRLENHVDARNIRSITWLRWMGFKIDNPKPYGALQKPFHRFWMEV